MPPVLLSAELGFRGWPSASAATSVKSGALGGGGVSLAGWPPRFPIPVKGESISAGCGRVSTTDRRDGTAQAGTVGPMYVPSYRLRPKPRGNGARPCLCECECGLEPKGLCRGRDPGGREVATSRLSGPVAHQGYLRAPGRMRGLVRWSVWECMGGGWAWEAPARYEPPPEWWFGEGAWIYTDGGC